MAKQKEFRDFVFTPVEQEQEEKQEMILEGYAIVFEEETLIGGEDYGWYETIDRHALDKADMKDVPLKYNHESGSPILARTRNGSLTLEVDDHGLKVRAKLLDTQDARDMYARVKAGLLDKMSFACIIERSEWTSMSGETPHRRILEIGRVFDVSIVDLPAYEGTEINARSREKAGYIDKSKRNYETLGLVVRWNDGN